MKEFEFSYDRDNDDLFIFRRDSKSKGSVELGNLILDFDYKKNLVGIEIINATEYLSEVLNLSRERVREILCTLKKCNVRTKLYGNAILILIILQGEKEEKNIALTVPDIRQKSPAVLYG